MTPRAVAIPWLLTAAGLFACYHFRSGDSPRSPELPGDPSPPARHARPRPASDPSAEAAATLAARRDTAAGMEALAIHLLAWAASDEKPALRWTRHWISTAETQADSRAAGLLAALARNGGFAFALRIAKDLKVPLRDEMVELTLSIQATTAPLDAWEAAGKITDAGLRERARLAVLDRGSDAWLPQLADLATQMPGDSQAIAGILKRWALQDPAALSEWLNSHPVASAARDLAASHLVLRGDSENRSPEVAAAWAETISEPALRREAMQAATRELASRDPGAARAYLAASTHLTAEEKAAIASTLLPPP